MSTTLKTNIHESYNYDKPQPGDAAPPTEQRQDASFKTRVKWIRNKFGLGVFLRKGSQGHRE